MTSLAHAIDLRGGLIATHELHAIGYGRQRIRDACDAGALERIRQGWYALPGLPVPMAHAARVGGRLDCLSAAAAHDLWLPERVGPHRLHVAVRDDRRRLRSPTAYRERLHPAHGIRVHWHDDGDGASRLVVPPAACINSIASCRSAEDALVVAESALRRRMIGRIAWEELLLQVPARTRAVLATASNRSESGTETLFVHRMRAAGVELRQQVEIAGVGRVDVLIGDRLVTELDSATHHTDQLADRRRDALLRALGYDVLRFMYRQVVSEWRSVEEAVFACLAHGDHLRRPYPRFRTE